MPWIQAHLELQHDQAETAERVFEELGAVSTTFRDARDEPVLETLPDEIRLWQHVILTGLFEFSINGLESIRQQIEQTLQQDMGNSLKLEILDDRPWERVWLEHFRPIDCGNRLWICPTGQQPPDADATTIILDPGMAFGTGTHPTTALCLAWLAENDLTGKRVIDFGCGSGILAIAALKLGAASAVGLDHDPQALTASRDNALKNQVSEQFTAALEIPPATAKADIVMANILAGVLIELAAQIGNMVCNGGSLVLSGLLPGQATQVSQCYAEDFDMQPAVEKDGWIRLTGVRLTPN